MGIGSVDGSAFGGPSEDGVFYCCCLHGVPRIGITRDVCERPARRSMLLTGTG